MYHSPKMYLQKTKVIVKIKGYSTSSTIVFNVANPKIFLLL